MARSSPARQTEWAIGEVIEGVGRAPGGRENLIVTRLGEAQRARLAGRWIGTYHFSHVVPIVEVELVHQGVGAQ